MTDGTEPKSFAPPPHEGSGFRATVGLMVVTVALGALLALYIVAVPEANRDLLQFALGIVFGWAGSVVASEYGASATGRKAANAAIDQMKPGDKP